MSATTSTYERVYPETQSTTIRYEWCLHGLKHLFESSVFSTDSARSEATFSPKFGGDQWQIVFYANGVAGGDHIGLFLSAIPTEEERDRLDDGNWVREGHKFKFEVQRPDSDKSLLYSSVESSDQAFSSKSKARGWPKFAPRNGVYFRDDVIKKADQIIIVCSIMSDPVPQISRSYCRSVPNSLLHTVGGLLNEPEYSDVEFIFPRHRSSVDPRKIVAARGLLERVEYFETLFYSEFSEASRQGRNQALLFPPDKESDEPNLPTHDFNDSDDSEDDEFMDEDEDEDDENGNDSEQPDLQHMQTESTVAEPPKGDSVLEIISASKKESSDVDMDGQVSHLITSPTETKPTTEEIKPTPDNTGLTIVVRDAAYSTYYAILYYIYTDIIVFAPLSSSFIPSGSGQAHATSEASSSTEGSNKPSQAASTGERKTRKDWIRRWRLINGGRPAPCSAKSVYRIADRLDLTQLKEAAFQFIIKSLTVDNIVHELFSSFSMVYEDIREVQVKFFLDHWATIRMSEAMTNVWQEIRTGQHPGFENVWPVIVSSLQVMPLTST